MNKAAQREAWKAEGREKRARRRREGRCIRCSDPLPAGYGYALCPACRDAANAYYRERYAQHRESGTCHQCGGIARDGMAACFRCAVKMAEDNRKRRRKEGAHAEQ